MKARVVQGFDYRSQQSASKTMREWNEEIERIESSSGSSRRIGGDLTAFNAEGRMMFEIYDHDKQEEQA